MEIIKKELGPEANILVEIKGGKLVLSSNLDTSGADASASISVDSDYFIDKLAEKIPGTVDDAIFAVLKAALKSL